MSIREANVLPICHQIGRQISKSVAPLKTANVS
jgi:hypothetical protein